MTSAPPPAASGPAKDHRWQAFGVAVAVASLTILDLSKINVALPAIEDSLPANSTQLQIIVAGYALAFGLLLIPAGRFGDLRNRKSLFLFGLAAFGAASVLCAVSVDATMLVVARILQGVAAGILMPQVLGLMQEMFQGRERGRAFGLFGAIIGLSTAFGPALGGLLIAVGGEQDGWRLTFWMNIPLAVLLIPVAVRLLPNSKGAQGKAQMDLIGILLIGIAVFSLMLPFVLTSGSPTDDPARWLWLVVFAVSAVAFWLWERHYKAQGKTPVLNFALLRHRSYRYGLLIATMYFAAMPPFFLVQTLYLQQGLHVTPVVSGLVTIPFALSFAATAWIGGRYVFRFGRRLVVVGLLTVLVGVALTIAGAILAPVDWAPWLMAAAMLLTGLGGGFVISPNQTLTLSEIPVAEGGVAGSVTQVSQRAGTAIGVAAASSTFYATIFQETGSVTEVVVYHHALFGASLVVFGFLVAAIVFALLDRGAPPPSTAQIPVQPQADSA